MTELPDDDETTELPTLKPAFRTPAEWQALYDRLPRLLAAVASATRLVDAVHDAEPPEDAPAEVNVAFEQEADQAVEQERHARDALIQLLLELVTDDASVGIITHDGTIVAYAPTGDGLAIVPASQVHKLS